MKMPVNQWSELLRVCGVGPMERSTWAPVFAATMNDNSFSKGSEEELPPFLANVLHETGRLRRMEENLNYSAKRIREVAASFGPGTRWHKAGQQADHLANNPEALAEVLYGGRYGNRRPGDGWRYRGRGPGQITFHDNYALMSTLVGQDLVGIPDLAAQPHFGLEIFLAWWEDKVPDALIGNDALVRRVVNGGSIGLAEVVAYTNTIRRKLAEMLP